MVTIVVVRKRVIIVERMNRTHNDSLCRPDKSSNFTKDIEFSFTGQGRKGSDLSGKWVQIDDKDGLPKKNPEI